MTECFGSAVIDTACTWTVCGQERLDSYITELNQNEMKDLRKTETLNRRDGKVVYSTRKFKIPAKLDILSLILKLK